MADGKVVRIGSDIPPYVIHTVELAMSRDEERAYYRIHESQAKDMGRGLDEETGDGRVDFTKNRRLQHAVLDPRLDQLARISTVKEVNKWYGDCPR